jgi:integrase
VAGPSGESHHDHECGRHPAPQSADGDFAGRITLGSEAIPRDAHGRRLRGLMVILWRVGRRAQEALALTEGDLDQRRGSLLVRRGKRGRRREVGMDDWGWRELQPWLERRLELPTGPLFCVINGATGGRPWATAAARAQLRRTAADAGVRRRFAPHQLRHAHAVAMAREGVPLIVIQRQLGHSNLGITSVDLQGIDNAEIIDNRPRPPRTDDPRQRITPTLKTSTKKSRSSRRVALGRPPFAH